MKKKTNSFGKNKKNKKPKKPRPYFWLALTITVLISTIVMMIWTFAVGIEGTYTINGQEVTVNSKDDLKSFPIFWIFFVILLGLFSWFLAMTIIHFINRAKLSWIADKQFRTEKENKKYKKRQKWFKEEQFHEISSDKLDETKMDK